MPIVQSIGRLTSVVARGLTGRGAGSMSAAAQDYARAGGSYATIYRTQPAVRTVVDFIARNIAQLGIHGYARVSDIDRRRDTTSALARLIARPNPYTTTYRLIEHSLIDWGVFGNAYIVKLREDAEAPPVELWRVPAQRVQAIGDLYPEGYSVLAFDGRRYDLPAADVVHIREANVYGGVLGLSRLETLRKRLLEEAYLQDYRLTYWQQGARIPGVVHRPLDAPEWDAEARKTFRQSFTETYGGPDGAGLVPVLDEGMTYHEAGHSAEQQQLNEARELHDEEVTRSYFMPLPMVGLLRRATFSNIREQHKNLYQDGLGPTIQMLEQELTASVAREFFEIGTYYLELNVAEKLRGSFEEQAAAFQTAVGRPWMSVNEARAIQNLPLSPNDADNQIAAPLNMTTSRVAGGVDAISGGLFERRAS